MRTFVLSFILLCATAWAQESLSLRIRETQDLLLSQGPTSSVLDSYDSLVADIESAEEKLDMAVIAQVYYKKALVELSLSKISPAVSDLIKTLDYDPTLAPASSKLLELLLERGQFGEIRSRFSTKDAPDVFAKMDMWTQQYEKVEQYLADKSRMSPEECLEVVNQYLIPVTPLFHSVYNLHLQCSKKRVATLLGKDGDSADLYFKDIIGDYSKILKLQPQKNLELYNEFAQYALFTENLFSESWNVVKSCLRINNDFKSCADLSKTFSRLQGIFKPLEEYSQVSEMLYFVKEDLRDKVEALEMDDLDYKDIYNIFESPVKLPKREAAKLPRSVKSSYDYLIWKAQQFAQSEFHDQTTSSALKFVQDLNKFACEAGVRSGHAKNKFCKLVNENEGLFLPKHLAKIDELLQKNKFSEAKELLLKFNKNVRRTALFKERWSAIERFQQRQQHQHQQQQFHRQQQQRQRQRQQRHEPQHQHDPSKDYYKILDIPKDADEKTIKKGYRTQTLKYHPDKYKGKDLSEKEIETKMQEINEAYEVLSNPQSKADYDNRNHRPQGSGRHGSRNNGGREFVNVQFNPQDFFRQQGFHFEF
ncbi:hypothetical protein E0198_002671 [Clavispora lusitaniae]|nr:hypothetical protein E0198_002671 [Clavispora lusitaniae]